MKRRPYTSNHSSKGKRWNKGTVVECLDNTSYEVAMEDGTVIKQNRVHLRPNAEVSMPGNNNTEQETSKNATRELPINDVAMPHTPHTPKPPAPLTNTHNTNKETQTQTKQPARYKDLHAVDYMNETCRTIHAS